MRLIIHLDLDAFFCSVEELYDSSLVGKPFAVGGSPDKRGVVSSCSYPARRMGIHSAMPMAQAVKLCPGLTIIHPRFDRYVQYSKNIFTRLADFTPLMQKISIDEAFLDCSDIQETSLVIAQKIQSTVNQEFRLPCSLGVAANKLVAKIATNVGKSRSNNLPTPNAILIVAPGDEAAFLAPLPVKELWGVGPKTAERLNEQGIQTIGDLAVFPVKQLRSLFGKYGESFARRALGIDNSPISLSHEIKSISQETTFDKDVKDQVILKQTIQEQAFMVARRLRHKGFTCHTIKLKMRWPNFQTFTRQVSLTRSTDQDQIIFEKAWQLFLDSWNGKQIRLVGVGVSNLKPADHQLGLWDQDLRRSSNLSNAIDEIRSRYGNEIISKGVNDKSRRKWSKSKTTANDKI